MLHVSAPPRLEIIVDSDGLAKVVIDVPSGGKAKGLALLGRVLPALEELNRAAQKLSEPGT